MKNSIRITALVLGLFLVLFMFACELPIDIAGSYTGIFFYDSNPSTQYGLNLELTQNGKNISGTAILSYDGNPVGEYSISAEISGTSITGVLQNTVGGLPDIDISAVTNDTGTAMTGTSSTKEAVPETGQFEAAKS